ncbi:Hypothetical protein SRAE_X000083000 [Strongyloides ratti]|uniref:Copper transporter n=1 Tax=Strongyloides ratti TaxID=34506 RepID=A0A090LNR3_STRRB|nr:Hypothetical protein SRAE_X000083000 [Strongyloides ratti]CEF71505.1 Hypothetical protein SRAE_X000083000 [Strongyloides ratti]
MTIPTWAIYTFITCFVLLAFFLTLDYLIIRRKKYRSLFLGNRRTHKRTIDENAHIPYHHKRSTNMVLQM